MPYRRDCREPACRDGSASLMEIISLSWCRGSYFRLQRIVRGSTGTNPTSELAGTFLSLEWFLKKGSLFLKRQSQVAQPPLEFV
ncbi:MAG TPA: hypothetical protein DCE18_09620 [Syntrophobacteraceae bacterium]|nr:hypothetical protein [Syntrophobacteraceae bacterium]